MPKGAFKRILEALTNNNSSFSSTIISKQVNGKQDDVEEYFSENSFKPCKTIRHGFPHKPSALTYDPVQELLAIGCASGSIRIFGQEGVDFYLSHDAGSSVVQLLFLCGQGALISVCSDNTIHLWNFRQKHPAILHSLNFKRDNITFCHIPNQSNWIYIGTDKGNTNICNIETFTVSGYAINWNKAVELSQKIHPGAVVSICENPTDENKLLISFKTGLIVLWDLKNQLTEQRYQCGDEVTSTCWRSDGKQFLCGLTNGSLVTWEGKSAKLVSQEFPHAKSKKTACSPIDNVQWISNRNESDLIVFCGGLPLDSPARHSVTVMKGRSIVALQVAGHVIDFCALPSTSWKCDFQDPKELAILTDKEIILTDLETPGYPPIESGHAMDIHDSPVTCLKFVPDPNTDLIPGLYQVAAGKVSRTDFSKKDWPIRGGEWSKHDVDGVPELFVTGHADGSVRFWDASAVSLKSIYKLRTKKLYKKEEQPEASDDDPHQITHISVCPESRTLVTANDCSVLSIFKFSTQEAQFQIETLRIPGVHDGLASNGLSVNGADLPGNSTPSSPSGKISPRLDFKNTEIDGLAEVNQRKRSFDNQRRRSTLRLKSGPVRQSPGFQTDLVCLFSESDPNPFTNISCLTINTSYQLLSLGTSMSICVIDTLQKNCLLHMCTAVLLKSIDKRINIKSPSLVKTVSNDSQTVFSFDANALKSAEEANGKSGETKTKWKAATKKSRNPTKSIGDLFNPSRTILNFRRSSLLPKSPVSVSPPELVPRRSQTNADILRPEIVFPDPELSPALPDDLVGEPFDFPDEVTQPGKSKFVTSDDDDGSVKKPDSEPGLRPDSVLSRSSATSDHEHLSASELVSFLSFANNFTKQNESISLPCLWVGTSGGYLFNFIVHLPHSPDMRSTEAIVLSPSGSLLQLKGGIVHFNFLDSSGHLISAGAGNWRDHSCPGTITVTSSPNSSDCEQANQSAVDKQFMVVCSEQQAKIFTLPSQACIQVVNFNVSLTCYVTNASVDMLSNGACLVCVTTNGYVSVYNLPSLNPLIESPYLPPNDPRVTHTLCFGPEGQAIYMASPSEIQRFTYSLDTFERIQDATGHLFVPRKSPDRPSIGFLSGLFGGGYNAVDRQELFGDSRASRGLAQHVPGSGHSSLAGLRGSSGSFASDLRKLQMQVNERGDKLSQLDDRVEKMNEAAGKLATSGSSLVAKYRNKKWYQL